MNGVFKRQQYRSRKFSSIFLSFAILMNFPFLNYSYADERRSAYVAPDSSQVPIGAWRGFFTPNAFDSVSYVPLKESTNFYISHSFSSVLPPCDQLQQACIQELDYRLGEGTWQSAEYETEKVQRLMGISTMNPDGSWSNNYSSFFDEDIARNLPQGDAARLWKFPFAPHGGGEGYLVRAIFSGGYDSQIDKYFVDNFNLDIIPQNRQIVSNGLACESHSRFTASDRISGKGFCSTNFDFPDNIEIRVILKLGLFVNQINGWFDTRIRNVTVNIDTNKQILIIQGKPSLVPTAATRPIKYEDLASLGLNSIPENIQKVSTSAGHGTAGGYQLDQPGSMEEFVKLGSNIQSIALGENSIWQISSILNPNNSKCLIKGILNGIVSTNSTVFDSTAPTWNEAEQSLDFRVGAAHFDSNEKIFNGYYKLLVNKQVARCLWGGSLENARASISVISSGDQQLLATTSTSSDSNWVNFEASGFNFSTPTIRVKYEPLVQATSTPSISQSNSILKTTKKIETIKEITCIKGNVTKKLKGINMKCPVGFKKK